MMLKPRDIETLPDTLIELYSRVEQDILTDMARRISTYDYWIPSVEWQRKKLIEMGNYQSYIIEALTARAPYFEEEIRRLMQEAGTKSLKFDTAIYKQHGLNPPPLAASEGLRRTLKAGLRRTQGTFKNLTATTANTAAKQFEDALDRAWLQVKSGAFDQRTATQMAIKDLAKQGVGAIKYPSGHVDNLEVAVTRAIRTGVNQTCLQLQSKMADEMGCDLVEVTAHAGARPEHAAWQGQIYSRSGNHPKYPEFESSTGYGTGAGLGGWNCRHSFFPYFEGTTQTYSKKQLKEYEAKNYEYNDQKMTEYEATQHQRYIERQIRRWKREEQAMKAAGISTDEAAGKVAQWQAKQKDFLKQTGLKRRTDREQVARACKRSGLSVGNSTASTNHRPKFIGMIDVDDKRLVEFRLKEFENSVVKEPVEHAIVILQNGKTYRFVGEADRVNPEILGRALNGSVISHNHPMEETRFSFSMDDFDLFQKYQLAELRGFDEKYEYVLRRTGRLPEIKELGLHEMSETDYWHQQIYNRAKDEGVYYERIKRTDGSRRD